MTVRMRHLLWSVTVSLVAQLSAAVELPAQINAENFARLGFNFSPPGARASALGGAFIPLADDATAAESNPAGLTVLLYPQVSGEFKGIEYRRSRPPEGGGGASGTEFLDRVGMLSFASVVYPVGRFRLAAFRHELVNYRNTEYSAGTGSTRLYPYTSRLEMNVQNLGGAVAVTVGPNLSLGIAGGRSLLDMSVDFSRYAVGVFEPGLRVNQMLIEGEGSSASGNFLNVGALLRFGEVASVGAVYKTRPKFKDLTYAALDVQGKPLPGEGGPFEVNVPDAYGFGVSIRPHPLLMFAVDAVLNRYSQLAKNVAIAYEAGTTKPLPTEYVADDGMDIHAGVEYVLVTTGTPVALRAGVSRVAPSNTYYKGTEQGFRDLWGTGPGDAITQASIGLGSVIKKRMQFDAAAVLGSDRREVVTSIVFFFGRT